MNKIYDAIRLLLPNVKLVMRGIPENEDDYLANTEWHDDRPQPSWLEIQAAIPQAETTEANRQTELARAAAYRVEADPLFFGWQRGENTEQEWLDKVAEIRARFSYSE